MRRVRGAVGESGRAAVGRKSRGRGSGQAHDHGAALHAYPVPGRQRQRWRSALRKTACRRPRRKGALFFPTYDFEAAALRPPPPKRFLRARCNLSPFFVNSVRILIHRDKEKGRALFFPTYNVFGALAALWRSGAPRPACYRRRRGRRMSTPEPDWHGLVPAVLTRVWIDQEGKSAQSGPCEKCCPHFSRPTWRSVSGPFTVACGNVEPDSRPDRHKEYTEPLSRVPSGQT